MRNIAKYQGIIPAFYACYGEDGSVSAERTQAWAEYLLKKGVKGVYVCGSSGECIYQTVEERERTLEAVMEVVKGKMTVIAHCACNNTAESCRLAAHAQSLGVDAVAAIPPIYFHLPDHAIAQYWNDISAAAPDTEFIIYNIPQLAGVALTMPLFKEMLKNPRFAGVKNSSMPAVDIQMFKMEGGEDFAVFNGPDEQLVAGLAIGADGAIGGTFGVMVDLFLKLFSLCKEGDFAAARKIQNDVDAIIYAMCACKGNLYAVMKEIIKRREGLEFGGARKPLPGLAEGDLEKVENCIAMIDRAVGTHCK